MDDVEFRLIGAMEVRAGDAVLRLPGPAERRLLAVLLVAGGRAVPASSLVDRLWSDDDLPTDPLNALQLRVSKLRRALAEQGLHDAVVREAAGYRARVEPGQVDVHRFGQLVRAGRELAAAAEVPAALSRYDEALGLWRGDPLGEFAGDPWAVVEAARLAQLHAAVLVERAEAALSAGRHLEVAADLEPLVAADPKQEALAGLLMTALYRSGRQADALEVYARTRRVLDDELGLEPSAALRALHQRVLQQDAALDRPPTPEPTPPVVAPSRTAAAAPRGAVPAATTPLLGRESELQAVTDLLSESRLVTLVGPGGAGKTALALAVAREVHAGYGDGALVCRLATVTAAADVPIAVADAVGVPLDGADPSPQVRRRLLGYLARRELLLLLDNCEHVIDAAARLADEILSAAPGVRLLATSREALAVPGEVQLGLGPLALPPPGAPAARVLDVPSTQLFVMRARAVRSDLTLTDEDLLAVADVCRRLDGMPLALELAAARVATLSVAEIAERLADRFALLTSGSRTADARQRTLRATVEWSHALLTDAERTVFRRLAVFHGGWTLAAAEAVVADDEVPRSQVLDLLDRLVSRSMVVSERGRATRFRMLETLRQLAAEQLAAAGEQDLVAARHAAFYRCLADQADAALRGPGQRDALSRLRQEQPNLRAALGWLSADAGRLDDALSLAGSLGLYWHLGRHVEGRAVLRQLVSRPGGSPRARARALQAVSLVERPRACLVHPSPRCADTARESLELFDAGGDADAAALSRVLLAVELLDDARSQRLGEMLAEAESQFAASGNAWGQAVVAFVRLQADLLCGDHPRARATGRAAVDAFRALDDPWGLSAVLYHLGWGLREFGSYAEAVPVLEEAVEVSSAAGLHNTAQWALADLGLALCYLSQVEEARTCFDRAALASREIGDAAGEVLAAHGRAVLAQTARQPEVARPLFREAVAGFERLATPLPRGHALAGLAWCDVEQGRLDDAERGYESLRSDAERARERVLVAVALEGLARVRAASGAGAQARGLLERAAVLRRAVGRPAPPHEQAVLERLVQPG